MDNYADDEAFNDPASSDNSDDHSSSASDDDDEEDLINLLVLDHIEKIWFTKEPQHTSKLRGHQWVTELVEGHPKRIRNMLRMSSYSFMSLCAHVVDKGYYKFEDHQKISVEDSVAIFLWLVASNPKHRHAAERFQHSVATISHHVKKVCNALQLLAAEIICPAKVGTSHPKMVGDRRFNPYFLTCAGAIDGTLIPVHCPEGEATRFRSRHATTCQNVLAVCDFEMNFIFVNSGHEGSAHDARVLADAAGNPVNQFPMPIPGWFYLGDGGYTNTTGFLAPHKNSRYHMQDFVGANGRPRTPEELFNRCHSCARNVIERTFGVLKKRFHILAGMPSYKPKIQAKMVIACCALHNWIKKHDGFDKMFRNFDEEQIVPDLIHPQDSPPVHFDTTTGAVNSMGVFRDQLTMQMWNNQQAHGPFFH